MAFDYKKSLIKVQGGRTYLPVSARIVWFREEHPDWGIITEPIEINHEKQYAVFKATIFNAEGRVMAMGTKKEDVKGFGDYLEKAETGSVGRALALCGYGTQFAPDLDESSGGRFADSPQPMGGNRFGGGGGGNYGGGGGGNRYGNNGGGGDYGGSRNDAPRNDGPRNEAPRNDGGSRFSPPREVSAPPPVTRDEPPARPAENQARPVPDAAPKRPAPAPVTADEDDEFEALVGGDALLTATEDDPFGDEDASHPAPAKPNAAPANTDTPAAPGGTPACVGCGKALTKAQQDLSIRNYGEALCPGCQKTKGPGKRPALAER